MRRGERISNKPSGKVKICPVCGGKCKVIDSRESSDAEKAIRRRYKCLVCNSRYSTIEIPVDEYMKLSKKYTKYKLFQELMQEVMTNIREENGYGKL